MEDGEETSGDFELIWGAAAIAREIRRTERQTNHLLATGKLPAQKVGNRYVAERGKLRRHFTGEAA